MRRGGDEGRVTIHQNFCVYKCKGLRLDVSFSEEGSPSRHPKTTGALTSDVMLYYTVSGVNRCPFVRKKVETTVYYLNSSVVTRYNRCS